MIELSTSHPISILLYITASLWLILPLIIPFSRKLAKHWACAIIFGSGSLCCLALGVYLLYAHVTNALLTIPFSLGVVTFTLRFDLLSAWFIVIIGLAGTAIAPYLPRYMCHLNTRVEMRIFWPLFTGLMFSMLLVVVSANVLTFLISWEMMSLTSFALVASDNEPRATRQAAWIYLGATRIGTGFLMAGFLWAYALTGSWSFTGWNLHGITALGPGLLILIGLGVKAGIWPFHLWLPIAHPTAPSPVSAIMSGVMVKTAIATVIRLFVIGPAFAHPAFGYIILIFGAVSAFWGVLFALLQNDLKKLLAYSTVENVGLIWIGIGISIAASYYGYQNAALVALTGVLLHALNHSLLKSLLFLGAGSVDYGTGTRDMNLLGGLGHRMPWTYTCFVLGSMAIAGLPPFNGFAGEWCLYQGALQMAAASFTPMIRFAGMLVIGWIALTGALAFACFIKAIGVTFQGRPRSANVNGAHEASRGMKMSLVFLTCLCVLLGLIVPVLMYVLTPVVTSITQTTAKNIVQDWWYLSYGSVIILLFGSATALIIWMIGAERKRPSRSYITWECGFGKLGPRHQVASFSFVQPIARMFGALYRYAEKLQIDEGRSKHFPKAMRVETTTVSLLQKKVYNPLSKFLLRLGDRILYLQEGSIHRYLLTMFLTLLALLIIGGYSR